jgi:hypothetical protein
VFPSVNNIPLSKKRIDFIIDEMIQKFNDSLVGRKIVKPVNLTKDDKESKEADFVTYGFNSIVDRIWFVDGTFDGSTYSYQGIGADFGLGLAESETAYIVNNILHHEAITTVLFDEPIKPPDIQNSLNILKGRNKNPTLLLANIRDELQLWHYREFQARGRICIPNTFSRLKNDVEINFLRSLPDGTSIILDSSDLGQLLIKKRIEETATITDIEESDYERILKEIPTLKAEQLCEKVRVLMYETIKLKINDPLSVIVLKQKTAE